MILNNIRLPIGYTDDDVRQILGRKYSMYMLQKLSLDKRDVNDIHYVASFASPTRGAFMPTPATFMPTRGAFMPAPSAELAGGKIRGCESRPVIAGAGPAGLFAGLILAYAGEKPIILERGEDADNRVITTERFRTDNILNPESNIQFGEGGAGTFSDGKLNTGTKNPHIRFILETFVKHGAPAEILYSAKPHMGTDRLRRIVKNIRNDITAQGGEVRFNTRVSDIITENGAVAGVGINAPRAGINNETFETKKLILATGHSARDVYELLRDKGVTLSPKDFSVGLRIEHKREYIDKLLHGRFAERLGAADYKYSVRINTAGVGINTTGVGTGTRGVYTFCVCPGGEVVNGASEYGGVVTNGMSDCARDGEYSNSAVLVSVRAEDYYKGDVLDGIAFQRDIERRAFVCGGSNYTLPSVTLGDFLNGNSGVRPEEYLPEFVTESLKAAFISNNFRHLRCDEAVLYGAETRSSAPVRIVRNESLCSNAAGLYPCGEGAGYAGGIVSAAADGIKCALAVLNT